MRFTLLCGGLNHTACVTSCVTCYVVPIVDSANEMFVRVFAQPCALGFQRLGTAWPAIKESACF